MMLGIVPRLDLEDRKDLAIMGLDLPMISMAPHITSLAVGKMTDMTVIQAEGTCGCLIMMIMKGRTVGRTNVMTGIPPTEQRGGGTIMMITGPVKKIIVAIPRDYQHMMESPHRPWTGRSQTEGDRMTMKI